jgi:tRNA(fMet)-specific endonuclease VapC
MSATNYDGALHAGHKHLEPFGADAARAYGPIRQATRERKRDQLDKLIAAHARSLGVVLVTNNLKDFAAYPEVRLENWLDEDG